ncbi:MAG TPA: alkaline phosphatase family protein [Nitrososphaerales archaeon]|nr:alkaline phosphatase family protein [Nitrososphaerales archaeon]
MLPPDSLVPDYHGYCLSNVPHTIFSVFGLDDGGRSLPRDAIGSTETSGTENVVLLLLDGLGYREWGKHEEDGFIGALSRKGHVKPISTVFPSTTAAALTTISTGLTPQEHGLPEWYVYMKEIGEVIVTLPFALAGEQRRDTLVGTMDPRALFDGPTIFDRLQAAGVRSTSLTNRALAHTAYSEVSRHGSKVEPHISASDLSVNLRRLVERAKGKNLFYVYWSLIDTIEHSYGPNTDVASLEASLISHALQEGFLSRLSHDAAKRTLVLATADHGQVNVDPKKTLFMNRFRKLVKVLSTNPSGKKIPPWGSARDVFISVDDEHLDETEAYLSHKLKGIASVLRSQDAIKLGLFGINQPSLKFRRRVGNLMILPHGTNTVWYKYRKGDSLDLRGHHGGLSPDEMTIPLGTAKVSSLQ